MARMVPAAFDESTVSAAERKLFELLKHDPATSEWIVLHSLGLSRRRNKPYGEIDFVVLIPRCGVFCLEVKGGRIACRDGEWETTDRYGQTERLRRSPFLQGRECMFAVRDSVLNRAPLGFPAGVVYGYAVVMPDISFRERSTEWEPWQAIDRDALARSIAIPLLKLAAEQRKLHHDASAEEPTASTMRTIRQLLRPDFEVVVSRGATIEDTEAQLLRLTEEQFDALDLLAGNERCLFEGAAGTGKTMLAFEYARRSSRGGRRTLLICFNRLLGDWLTRQAADLSNAQHLRTGSYFKLLRDTIVRSSIAREFLEREACGQNAELYEDTYSVCGKLAVEEQNEPYDVLVMDEAQDLLQHGVLEVLNVWLRGGLAEGSWAIFGDFQRQAIFGTGKGDELKDLLRRFAPQSTKGRLTFNCRNTRNIGEETALLSGFVSPPYRMGQVLGSPVDYRYYKSREGQATLVADQLRRLLEDGVQPRDIVVLSRHRLPNSGVANLEGGGVFRLVDAFDYSPTRSRVPAIRFATAQAFKGMESPVVILCDVDQVSDGEPQSLLYVAMSRARSHLIVLAQQEARPAIAECVRRKLQEGWNTKQ
jgi:hypothetical protein